MATSRAQANVTTDHDEIRRWAEARDAQPACVKGTGKRGDIGMLRLDFPGYGGEESLQHIGWEEWFEKFDERNLALLYQEQTAGGAQSNFNKLVSREAAKSAGRGGKTQTGKAGTRRRTPAKRTSVRAGSTKAARHRNGRTTSASSSGRSAARKTTAKKASSSSRSRTTAKRSGATSSAKRSRSGTGKKNPGASGRKTTARSRARKSTRSR